MSTWMTAEEAREMFDTFTGDLIWNTAPRYHSELLGQRAGTDNGVGYRQVQFNRKMHKVSHIVWLIEHGKYPAEDLDHINHDRSDNRLENLRLATKEQNLANSMLRQDNKSGYKGVGWHKQSQKWRARVTHEGKCYFSGCFDKLEDAVAARQKLAKELFGEFANETDNRSLVT